MKSIVGLSLVINLIIMLANDVEVNLGTIYKNIEICHANIQSLKAKDRLLHIESDFANDFDVNTLSETWLSPSDSSDILNLSGFQCPYRRDCPTNDGYGGVLVWVSNKISVM